MSDEPFTTGRHYYRFLTNRQGKAIFVLQRKSRVFIRVSGELHALDTIVPDTRDVDWASLVDNGTFIDVDRRGWY